MSIKRKLILVEDNIEQADFIRSLISNEVYDVKFISDGTKACEYLLHIAPNNCIVILDNLLPFAK